MIGNKIHLTNSMASLLRLYGCFRKMDGTFIKYLIATCMLGQHKQKLEHTCLPRTHSALVVYDATSCELYFVWEKKDRVTNLELPPKAKCPLSPQRPK